MGPGITYFLLKVRPSPIYMTTVCIRSEVISCLYALERFHSWHYMDYYIFYPAILWFKLLHNNWVILILTHTNISRTNSGTLPVVPLKRGRHTNPETFEQKKWDVKLFSPYLVHTCHRGDNNNQFPPSYTLNGFTDALAIHVHTIAIMLCMWLEHVFHPHRTHVVITLDLPLGSRRPCSGYLLSVLTIFR